MLKKYYRGGEWEMSDISHKKAMSILKELERMTGYPYEDAKDMYKEYRDRGETRENAVGGVWMVITHGDFEMFYEMDEGWSDTDNIDELMGKGEISDSKRNWIFEKLSKLTGYNYRDILRDYSEISGSMYTDYKTVELIWDDIMEKYLNHLIRGE